MVGYKNPSWTWLFQYRPEESTNLVFKLSGSLEKSDKKRAEIGKDVSAFANADWGIIVYSLSSC